MAAGLLAELSSRLAHLMIDPPCASYVKSPACSLEARTLLCPVDKSQRKRVNDVTLFTRGV